MKTIFDDGTGSSIGADESGVETTVVGSIDWGNKVGVGSALVGAAEGVEEVVIQAVEKIKLVQK